MEKLLYTPDLHTIATTISSNPRCDPALSYPTVKLDSGDTVPSSSLYLCILAPLFVAAICKLRDPRGWKEDVHACSLATSQSVVVSVLTTHTLKYMVGRYRPDYYALLATSDAALIEGGKLSYPSGHASFSMAVMLVGSGTSYVLHHMFKFYVPPPCIFPSTFHPRAGLSLHRCTPPHGNPNRQTTALYLLGKTGAWRNGTASLLAATPSAILVGIAVWIGATRIVDYRHNAVRR